MRELREKKGWSQGDLATELSSRGLSLHRQTIQKIEAGTRPLKLDEADLIADALGADMDWMLSHAPDFHIYVLRGDVDEAREKVMTALSELCKSQKRLAISLDRMGEPAREDMFQDITWNMSSALTQFEKRLERSRQAYERGPEDSDLLRDLESLNPDYLDHTISDDAAQGEHARALIEAHPFMRRSLSPKTDDSAS